MPQPKFVAPLPWENLTADQKIEHLKASLDQITAAFGFAPDGSVLLKKPLAVGAGVDITAA